MLLHHSLQDVIDGVREFTRPHPGKDVGKLQLPTLTGIQDYEKYSFQLYAVLEGIGICDIVKEMVKSKSENRQYMRVSKEADRTEGLGDDIVYVFQTRVGTHSWEPRRLNRRQAGELVLLGPQIISGKNFAHSIDLVFKNGVKFLPEIIAVWDQHYGQTTTSNEMENVIRFFSGKRQVQHDGGLCCPEIRAGQPAQVVILYERRGVPARDGRRNFNEPPRAVCPNFKRNKGEPPWGVQRN